MERAAGSEREFLRDDRRGWTGEELEALSAAGAAELLGDRADLEGRRVAHLLPRGGRSVAAQWAIWRAGGVSVPLALSHPGPELARTMEDADPEAVLVHAGTRERVAAWAEERGIRVVDVAGWGSSGVDSGGAPPPEGLPRVEPSRPALMLYTSGSTGRPKGVVIRHSQIRFQVESMVLSWGWSSEDRILHVLPLHHVHGLVNVLTTALAMGAHCRLMDRFQPQRVWDAFGQDLSLFMAVPTIYRRLIGCWEEADAATRARWSAGASSLRLMVSGSAALPVDILDRWEEISGQRLLERYGMTEIGMALTQPLQGERRPGWVGRPFPGVEVRVVDEEGRVVDGAGSGELEVRGPGVFTEYWRRPSETEAAFRDGWFGTGDEVERDAAGEFRILGRRSVDIIKTGGYKVSALEIEEALRAHPWVAECAVVGLADPEWGERVAAVVVREPGAPSEGDGEWPPPDEGSLRAWLKERLAPYKVPRSIRFSAALPRNAMGKVVKPAIVRGWALGSGEPSESSSSPARKP